MFRLKEGSAGTRILKGAQIIVLSEDMSQTELWHLHITLPGYTEEYNEKVEAAKKQVEEYSKPKKKDVKGN